MKRIILSRKQVRHVAQLADLKLTKEEVAKFQKQLSETLDYVAQLNELETKGIKPTSQVTGLESVFREDEPGPSLSQEKALSGAKTRDRGFFKTKSIF